MLPQTSDQCKQALKVKHIGSTYWQQLIQIGIPKQDARTIAVAIAKYDVMQCRPRDLQKQLICHYSAFVCRAKLWRAGLLVT
ncbi:MAG: hypothetical protein F6K31_38855 [Symploca sp. SIO2G7]|nr:hypothetical protein [Symploca sp. SIO2G7]